MANEMQEVDEIVKVLMLQGGNGTGIADITQTTKSEVSDGDNIITVTLSDGTKSTFNVKNGSRGEKGDQGEKGEQGIQGEKGEKGADGTMSFEDLTEEQKASLKGDTGVGVQSIEQTTTSEESGGTNIITATLTDGTTSEFKIKNGEGGGGGASFSVTIPSSGWSGDSAPYTNAVDVEGALGENNYEIVGFIPTGTLDNDLSVKEQLGYITYFLSADGTLTFVAGEDVPEIDLPVMVRRVM